MKTTLLLAASLLGLAYPMPACAADAPRDPAAVPDGLSATAWSSIRAAYEAGRHAFVPQADGTHLARNNAQQWRMSFDGRGFTATPDGGGWEWGLELVQAAMSPGETPETPTAGTARLLPGNRLSFERDAVLEEWFVNDGRGLEQGWTFKARPPGAGDDGSLRLVLAVRGGLQAHADDSGERVSFRDAAGATLLTYGGLKAWDADGKPLPARLTAQANAIAVEVNDIGARYPVTIDPIAQRAYLKASNTGGSDQFGISVALSGDTVVVGASEEASNATGINGNQTNNSLFSAGAAYVFVRTGPTWTQQAYLKASNTGAFDQFGVSVAISGNTVVVGASGETSNATGVGGNQANNSLINAGAAYVFVRTGTAWAQQAYLKASNTGANDQFGVSVAVSGDTVVVGAHWESSNATGVGGNQADNSLVNAGAAYVFQRTGSAWAQQAYLKASNTDASDFFGRAVAVSGDTVVVGAEVEGSNATGVNAPLNGGAGTQADNSFAFAGAAYVFVRTGTAWTQQVYLKASNTGAQDNFGRSVAVSGDTVVVGAVGEASNATGVNAPLTGGPGTQDDNSAGAAGAAYVFVRTGQNWTQQAYLKASNSEGFDNFGISVAVSGDTVVVGAVGEASNATGIYGDESDNNFGNAGAAYVFVRRGTVWNQWAYLKASNTDTFDQFGRSVAVSGDTAVIGAFGEDSNATGVNAPLIGGPGTQTDNSSIDSGAAYIFTGLGPVLPSLARTNYSAPGSEDILFSTIGPVPVCYAAVNGLGSSMFDHNLIGTGSTGGRNRGIFSTLAPGFAGSPGGRVDLAFLNGTALAGVGGYVLGSSAFALATPLLNQDTLGGLFLVTTTGTGVTANGNFSNDELLLKDDGNFLSVVRRTGQAVPELGGALPNAFQDVLQSHDQDLIAVCHTMTQSLVPAIDVIASNDSGLLMLNHLGALTAPTPPREGDITNPKYGTESGKLGQFTGRAAAGMGDRVHFSALFLPTSGPAVQALFWTNAIGTLTGRTAKIGDPAPGTTGATFTGTSFPAFSQQGPEALFLANLSVGGPNTNLNNLGLWRGATLLTRKNDLVDNTNLPGLRIGNITKFWPVGADQVVLQVTLIGGTPPAGPTNNSALLLRQANGTYLVLMRTGQRAPGAGPATVQAIVAVDVNPVTGHYAVQGNLSGTLPTSNQAIWAGQTTLGDDTLLRHLRLPFLRLRRGDRYMSSVTALATINGLTLRPAVDATGAGGRGLAQAVGSGGHVAVYITTENGGVTELVLLKL